MFINNMNAEGIVDQLRQKLVEVEARVLAAAERRQDILTGITVRQRYVVEIVTIDCLFLLSCNFILLLHVMHSYDTLPRF